MESGIRYNNIGMQRGGGPCEPNPIAGDSLMTKTVHGTIRGKFIELAEGLGLAEGQEVEIEVKAVEPPKQWGAGIRATAGALADDVYWDAIMDEVHQARKVGRRSQGEFE